MTAGVMVAVWEGSVSGSVTGLFLCCTGTVCNAAMMSTTGKVMSEKLDVLRLAFYTAPVSCAILLPLFYIREVTTTPSSNVSCIAHPALIDQHEIRLIFSPVHLPNVQQVDLEVSNTPV